MTSLFFSSRLIYRVVFVAAIHIILSIILSLSTAPEHLNNPDDFISFDVIVFALSKAVTTLSNLFVLDILIATSIYFVELNYNNMIIPILTTGYSRFNMIRLFIPAFIILGLLNFTMFEYAQKWSDRTLQSLGVSDFKSLDYSSSQSFWLRNDTDILYLEKKPHKKNIYFNTLLFKRNSQGMMSYMQKSKSMVQRDDAMIFSHVKTYFVDPLHQRYDKTIKHQAFFSFETIDFLNIKPNNIPIEQLYTLIQTSQNGIISHFIYEANFYNRLSAFFKPLSVIILVLSLIPIVRRNAQYGLFFLFTSIIGFSSFLLDKFFFLMAEYGIIAPYLSGNLVVFLQIICAIALLLKHEKLGK